MAIKRYKKAKLGLVLASSWLMISGCATSTLAPVEEEVRKTTQLVTEALAKVDKPREDKDKDLVRRHERAFIPISKVQESEYQAQVFLNKAVMVNRPFASLQEAASFVTSLSGVPVTVDAQVQKTSTNTGAGPMTGATAATPIPTLGGNPNAIPNATAMATANANSVLSQSMITYNGPLAGLLDVISARFNVFWEPVGSSIRFYKTKSRTFRLAALPGDSSMSSTIGSQTSGTSATGTGASVTGGGSSNSEMRSGIKFDSLSIWKAIEDSVKTMLTVDGKVVVTPATGTLTVEDTPVILDRVEAFIQDQNRALVKQVVLNVRVLSVNLTASDSYGINWDAVYKNIGKGIEVGLSSASGLATGASRLNFNIIKTPSKWEGTQVILEALSKQGKVSQVTSASIMTINNQPAPIRIGSQRAYLASSTTTIGTGGSGNTVSLTPGTVNTGFSMSVLPHILDNDALMLQYSSDISELLDVQTVTSGGSSIQTPIIDTRNFLQRVIVGNGETLVLTGFEQLGVSGQSQGIGDANNVLFGGGVKKSDNRTMLVLLIQPIIVTAGGN